MPVYQSWNPKLEAYVKYEFARGGIKWDVKEKSPSVPFKGVPIKKRK